ncbi:MAG: hypothetical protein QOG46_1671, partial [Pseudonocardiales bacterium]|nr:hypothetical protein [Pseudonocardiales bacterium]
MGNVGVAGSAEDGDGEVRSEAMIRGRRWSGCGKRSL